MCCGYLHPDWNIKYCVQCIQDKHEVENTQDTIIAWETLSKKVYELYNIGGMNPENICAKIDCNCEQIHNADLLNSQFCIHYFQGNCPFKKCSKVHLTWEKYKMNQRFSQSYLPDLYPCNNYSQRKQLELKEIQKEVHQKEMSFKLKQQIRCESVIDFVFIMDCTGTMQKWINSCRDQIQEAAQLLLKQNSLYQIRLAFIGYRDYEDEEKLITLDFTYNFDEFTNRLKKIKAQGGDDEAEDVLSGLNEALKLNFADNPKSILITCLFADAPCHGKQYHDENVNDDYEEGVDQGSLEQLITQYKQIKINNFFFCIDIDKSTEKMYSIMQRVWPAIVIRKNFQPDEVNQLFQNSIAQSITISEKRNQIQNQYSVEISQARDLHYQKYENQQRQLFWKEFNLSVNQSQRSFNSEIYIKQSKEKEEGETSNIFLLYDLQNQAKYVTKISRKIVELFENEKQIPKELLDQHQNEILARFYNQEKAKLLASIYREKTAKIKGAPPIFFVSPVLIKLLNSTFFGLKELYAETYINLPDIEWIKYSNNGSFQDIRHYYMSSFSHFSYVESCGEFVLTDLQGKSNILTDPAFHHLDDTSKEERERTMSFRETTDHSSKGIVWFKQFQHQICSGICQELGYQTTGDQNEQQKISQWKPTDENKISAICQSCNRFLTITLQHYREGNYSECECCKNLKQKSFKNQCQCCRNLFEQPIDFNLARHTIISNCLECKEICQQNQLKNACYYCGSRCKQKIQNIKNQFICQIGLNYLKSLICRNCQQANKNSELICQEDYIKGNFLCQNCQI